MYAIKNNTKWCDHNDNTQKQRRNEKRKRRIDKCKNNRQNERHEYVQINARQRNNTSQCAFRSFAMRASQRQKRSCEMSQIDAIKCNDVCLCRRKRIERFEINWFDQLRVTYSIANVWRVVYQMMNNKTKRNDVIEMKFCDYYSQMSYAQFVEFAKQNDENAQYELRESNATFNTHNEMWKQWTFIQSNTMTFA